MLLLERFGAAGTEGSAHCTQETGNILTGVPLRYIGLDCKIPLETVFNPKTTEWQLSYDG